MEVQIVTFPETRVAAVEHFGPPARDHDTLRKLIVWKIENRLLDQARHRSYGVHYTDPRTTPPSEHHVDFCLSFADEVAPNPCGVRSKVIPRLRCARTRDIGFRSNNRAAVFLHETWLPQGGELPGNFPVFFHYVNVGPDVREEDMITDVYLPLK